MPPVAVGHMQKKPMELPKEMCYTSDIGTRGEGLCDINQSQRLLDKQGYRLLLITVPLSSDYERQKIVERMQWTINFSKNSASNQ